MKLETLTKEQLITHILNLESVDHKKEEIIIKLKADQDHLLSQVRRLIDEASESFKETQQLKTEIRELKTTNLDTENFEIRIREDLGTGYFEHNEYGENVGGSLTFHGRYLRDFDGVYDLPTEVRDQLNQNGFPVSI